MSLKMTLVEAQAFQVAAAKLAGINIPRVTAYVIGMVVGDSSGPLEEFQKQRAKAAKDYCKLDDRGNPKMEEIPERPGMKKLVFKSAVAEEKFSQEIGQLGQEEFAISLKKRLALSAFQDPRSEDETCLPWDVIYGFRPILEPLDV